ncbi:hypothetical protein ACB092_07G019300 [Castanea dentata]
MVLAFCRRGSVIPICLYLLVGSTLFLIIYGIRQYLGHLTKEHHVGFEVAAWYWHFIDVVRLFLFVSIY